MSSQDISERIHGAGNSGVRRPLRVLHVYSGNLYGGVERVLVTLARERFTCPLLAQEFALCFDGRLREELIAAGATVHQLGKVRISRPWTVWRSRRALQLLIRQERYDVVICHSTWAQAVFGPAARVTGAPLVFWLHDAATGEQWLERWARYTPPDLAVCNSHFTAGTLDNLYPSIPSEVIYCPVEPPPDRGAIIERSAVRTERGIPADTAVIIQVSRLQALKGHLILMQALGRLRDTPGWVCWIVGGAQRRHELEYLEQVKRCAIELGVRDRVDFLGERSDVHRFLTAADIHCQPNTGPEAFGISFVEALYAGLPLVTSDLGGAKEIVTRDCGVLVPAEDVVALADELRSLVGDSERRARLGACGPARANFLSEPAARIQQLNMILARLGGTHLRRRSVGKS